MLMNDQIQPEVLNPQQVAFYEAFGFLVLRLAFSSAEMTIIERDFDAMMLEDRNGETFDENERQVVYSGIEKQPGFKTTVMEDERIPGSVQQLLGPGFNLDGTDANMYVGDTNWHGDHGWHPGMLRGDPDPEIITMRYFPGLKVAFYLDPVTRETGCLRVIPGGHIRSFHDSLRSLYHNLSPQVRAELENLGVEPRDVPSNALESDPGDVVFFSHQMWHASFGGRNGRRMISLNFKGKGVEK